MDSSKDRVPFALFLLSLAGMVFAAGIVVGANEWFPYSLVRDVRETLVADTFWIRSVDDRSPTPILNTPAAHAGLNLVTRFAGAQEMRVDLLDMDGRPVHGWGLDWFDLWPDADHVPDRRLPKTRPGTHVHGATLVEDGDLVFNFEHLGLMRLEPSGEVVWRLPYATHHSITPDESGNLWVSGQIDHEEAVERFPQRRPPFSEYTVLEVTPDGEVVGEWSIADMLEANGLRGLLHLSSQSNRDVRAPVDTDLLHLNDVEPFPRSMEEGFFRHGDVLVSLRNINTVLVFDRDTREVRFVSTGPFVRQHDPDFIDGNRFSVYDNNNVGPESDGQQSRIVIVDAAAGTSEVYFEGSEAIPFYSDIMGKHQWLPDGHLLITETMRGRAFELDAGGDLVWEYVNWVEPGTVGIVEEVQRIPSGFETLYR